MEPSCFIHVLLSAIVYEGSYQNNFNFYLHLPGVNESLYIIAVAANVFLLIPFWILSGEIRYRL